MHFFQPDSQTAHAGSNSVTNLCNIVPVISFLFQPTHLSGLTPYHLLQSLPEKFTYRGLTYRKLECTLLSFSLYEIQKVSLICRCGQAFLKDGGHFQHML